MTSSSLADENINFLDHNFLNNLQNDDQDILDEFLDQRVYDSLGTNTPVSGNIKAEPTDLLDNFYHPNSNNINKELNPNSNTNTHNTNNNNNNGLENSNGHVSAYQNLQLGPNSSTPPNNEYLYIDPHQYHNNTSSIYTSPYENKSTSNSNSNTTPMNIDHTYNNNNNNIDLLDSNNQLSPNSLPESNSQLSDYDLVRDELTKLKFGSNDMDPCPKSVDVPDPSYLDFSPKMMASLPYKLQLAELPTYSRVETQIKLNFKLSPPPPHALLHIPQDLISKNKFCLNESMKNLSKNLKENLLYLDTYVLTSDMKKSCNICPRCIKREQKRASRRKSGHESESNNNNNNNANTQGSTVSDYNTPNGVGTSPQTTANGAGVVKNNPNSWANEKMMKKALIFNCKEIVSFPPPNGLNNDTTKCLELSARIICYCRHHKESEGFKLLFVITNSKNEVVAKEISTAIMIMDRKKTNPSSKDTNDISFSNSNNSNNDNKANNNNDNKRTNNNDNKSNNNDKNNNTTSNHSRQSSETELFHSSSSTKSPNNNNNMHPLSPNSIDESASEAFTNTDNADGSIRGIKRKKLSVDDSYNQSTNPMFNGSQNGFSPTSNSDTNTSTHIGGLKPSTQSSSLHAPPKHHFGLPGLGQHVNQPVSTPSQQLQTTSQILPASTTQSQSQQLQQQLQLPSIQRIIPAQGPIRGGIEVTLLGFNFRPGLAVKFGSNHALATHCWSETTIVTYLPPATQPGQVLVSFENHENMMLGGGQQQQIFTYTDDTDRQLIELALQIVGLKMNGKLEDAKNIAKRIVGSDNNSGNNSGGNSNSQTTNTSPATNNLKVNKANIDWYNSAHKAVEQLTKSDLSTEDILINFLSLVDLPNCPIIIPNWQLSNKQGQSLLHLSTLKGYDQLIRFLITHGCKIDLKDNQGLTPLFLASMCGNRNLINIFIDCKSNWNLKLSNDKYIKDYCDLNVLDIFNDLQNNDHDTEDSVNDEDFTSYMIKNNNQNNNEEKLSKSMSLDSLNSMFTMNYGRHISKMVIENSVEKSTLVKLDSGDRHVVKSEFRSNQVNDHNYNSNYSSDFADSEYESNDDEFNENDYDYYDDDYEDYEYSDYVGSSDNESINSYNNLVQQERNEYSVPTKQLKSNVIGNKQDENDEGESKDENDDGVDENSNNGLWQKVKNVFNNDSENDLPSYNDLFPQFGQSSSFPYSNPKSFIERTLNNQLNYGNEIHNDQEGSSSATRSIKLNEDQDEIGSDSSEDMVVSYINRPRKTVENDKMLLFFWFPVLVVIVSLFLYVSIMGYKVESIENFKSITRNTIGNLMVGNERIGRVFNSNLNDGVENVLHATRRMLNE